MVNDIFTSYVVIDTAYSPKLNDWILHNDSNYFVRQNLFTFISAVVEALYKPGFYRPRWHNETIKGTGNYGLCFLFITSIKGILWKSFAAYDSTTFITTFQTYNRRCEDAT